MAAIVRGGITVKPHVQAFADACMATTGADSYGTYVGHSPPEGPTQALDVFTPDNDAGYRLQDTICAFAMENVERFGVRYMIRREYIWNIERADEGWRWQGHQGNRTADHFDHVHLTFYSTAADVPDPEPIPDPEPVPEEDDMRYQLVGVSNNRGIFLVGATPLGTKVSKGRIPAVHLAPAEVEAMLASNIAVRNDGADLPEDVFDRRFIVVG